MVLRNSQLLQNSNPLNPIAYKLWIFPEAHPNFEEVTILRYLDRNSRKQVYPHRTVYLQGHNSFWTSLCWQLHCGTELNGPEVWATVEISLFSTKWRSSICSQFIPVLILSLKRPNYSEEGRRPCRCSSPLDKVSTCPWTFCSGLHSKRWGLSCNTHVHFSLPIDAIWMTFLLI